MGSPPQKMPSVRSVLRLTIPEGEVYSNHLYAILVYSQTNQRGAGEGRWWTWTYRRRAPRTKSRFMTPLMCTTPLLSSSWRSSSSDAVAGKGLSHPSLREGMLPMFEPSSRSSIRYSEGSRLDLTPGENNVEWRTWVDVLGCVSLYLSGGRHVPIT